MKAKDLLAVKTKPSSSLGLNQLTRNWDLSTFRSVFKVEMVNMIVFPSKVAKVDKTGTVDTNRAPPSFWCGNDL
jgi:hypothetical protein